MIAISATLDLTDLRTHTLSSTLFRTVAIMATTKEGTHTLPDGTILYTKSWIVSALTPPPATPPFTPLPLYSPPSPPSQSSSSSTASATTATPTTPYSPPSRATTSSRTPSTSADGAAPCTPLPTAASQVPRPPSWPTSPRSSKRTCPRLHRPCRCS